MATPKNRRPGPSGQQPFGQPGFALATPAVPGFPPGVEVASMGQRLVARIVDARVLIPIYLVAMVLGATVGKKAMNIKVVTLADGNIPTTGTAAKRYGFYIGITVLTCGIGGLLIALSPLFDNSGRQQGWHDKLAGTVVIKA